MRCWMVLGTRWLGIDCFAFCVLNVLLAQFWRRFFILEYFDA